METLTAEEKYSTRVLKVEVGAMKEGVFQGLRKWSQSCSRFILRQQGYLKLIHASLFQDEIAFPLGCSQMNCES